ncbi:MAG: lipid A export permease/ATP-binding protein MsbA [Candidatus Nitricoxidivorans perseverans]|uniref:Lipid A export permease/ATP-binding protein MsbA n=1 Tax=Candidatus Nitricoxidivorans perseverans TaxID=2975601 RepID=A0AA49IXJ3_9PROT|nr:MAG: lipid A export permease/ATP-binding protein MsbA [Candidatus Nitricoxidivorans perseverans]
MTPPTPRGLYLRLLGYVRPYWRTFALAVMGLALMAATEPLFPALLKPLLDKGFAGKPREDLYLVPLAIVAIFLVRGIFGYVATYCMSWVSNRVIADLRDALFARIVRLPTAYLEVHPSSRLMTRVIYDVAGVAGATTTALTTLIKDSLTVVGLLSWLLWLNWRLTLVMAVVGPLAALVVRAFSSRLRASNRAGQRGMAVMTQALQETIDGHKLVKVYGGEAQEIARFGRVNNDLRRQAMRQTIAAAATVPIIQLLAAIALAVVVYIALLQSSAAQTSVGGFVSFITAMLMLLSPMKRLADVNNPLQQGLISAESVFAFLDEPGEEDHGTAALGRATGRIEFRQVSFRYASAARDALSRINLVVEPGQTVALVGASGGGKTTLANLLPRFHRPTEGGILIDGTDIGTATLASLRANIALVSQDVVLFDDTVAANIAYGQTGNVSRAAVEAAARAAHAHDFIAALPQGYDTLIGENGTRLSGGQRQRLAIARALLKNAPILILDEATSALDTESERHVQAALEALMQGRTTLVIAHRLSTIEHADRIVVLDRGRIVESGRHAELLAKNGAYAHLYRLQFAEST